MQGIRDVYFFIDALIEKFQAHPGNDGEPPEFEPILGRDRTVPSYTGVQITKRAVLCVWRLTTFITTILQRMIKIDAAGNSGDIVEQIVVVAHPRIEALCLVRPQLNLIRICIRSAGQRAEPAAALARAPACQVSAERLDLELRSLGEKLLILKHGVVALEPESIEKSTALSETVFHEDRVWRIDRFATTHAARFTMFFVVSIEREDEPAVACHIPHETWAAPVKVVVAICLTKSFLLPVVVVEVVAERADCAVNLGVIAIIVVAAKHVFGGEMKRRVLPRHFHHEIDGPTGLRSELSCSACANDFNALHRIQDWGIMRFRKTELLVLDRDAVFEHLRELAALRIQAAITEVDDWRLRLFADDNAGGSGHHLPIVVTGEGRELFRFHERGFLAGIDSRPFDWWQRGVRHRIGVEPGSSDDDALGLSRFGDAGYGQRPVFICVGPQHIHRGQLAAALVRAVPTGLIIAAAGLVTIDIVSVAFGNGSGEGILSQAGLNKTIERDPRQRGSQSKTNFRTHARDEK